MMNLRCLNRSSLSLAAKSLNACSSQTLFNGKSPTLRPQLSRLPNALTPHRHKFLDARDPDHEKKDTKLTLRHDESFKEIARKERNKKTYQLAVNKYLAHQGVQRRGHVEFINAALENMVDFEVEKDLDVYKQIMGLFPKGKMITRNMWQKEMMHYPKQQQCMIDVLDKMESHGVIPDDDVGYEIIKIFGKNTHPFRKYQRMMYWMPKFKYANPYYIPHKLPQDAIELAVMALKRMAVDLENVVTVFQSRDVENVLDDTFIASAQSAEQRRLIAEHPTDLPLYVEGGFHTWLRDKCLTYFVLKAEQSDRHKKFTQQLDTESDDEDRFIFTTMFEEEPTDLVEKPTLHEQNDGTILGMCITGTASKDSLASWIKSIQTANPTLAQTPIIFLLRTPESGIEPITDDKTRSSLASLEDVNR